MCWCLTYPDSQYGCVALSRHWQGLFRANAASHPALVPFHVTCGVRYGTTSCFSVPLHALVSPPHVSRVWTCPCRNQEVTPGTSYGILTSGSTHETVCPSHAGLRFPPPPPPPTSFLCHELHKRAQGEGWSTQTPSEGRVGGSRGWRGNNISTPPQLSHPFPTPNPILYLGIPCAPVKLMA